MNDPTRKDWSAPPEMTEEERERCSERASEAMNEHRQLGGMHMVASVAAAEAGRRDLWEQVRPVVEAAEEVWEAHGVVTVNGGHGWRRHIEPAILRLRTALASLKGDE